MEKIGLSVVLPDKNTSILVFIIFTSNQGTEGTTTPINTTESVSPTESNLTVNTTSTSDTGQLSVVNNIKPIRSERSQYSNFEFPGHVKVENPWHVFGQ